MRKILLILFILSAVQIFAQKAIVKDIQTLEPISNVYIFSDCKSGLTHADGIIDLKGFFPSFMAP